MKAQRYRLISVPNGWRTTWHVYDMDLRTTVFTAPGAGELAMRKAAARCRALNGGAA